MNDNGRNDETAPETGKRESPAAPGASARGDGPEPLGAPSTPVPGAEILADAAPATGAERAEGGAPVRGPDVIARILKTLPNGPGVYRMLDAAGEVIYVGKARSLKKRVQNYTRLGGHTNRIARMILETVAMEVVTTRTESEALLLEANLIKRFRPRFNVLLRDDKSFPYILIARDHGAPQILKHRGARKRAGDYFGPFASAGAVDRTINTLQRAFLLRTCSDAVYESRTRPCLLFQIKRCSGPCTGEISREDYDQLANEAVRFLSGKGTSVRETLNDLMTAAAERLEFEQAARYRNRLWALAHVQQHQGINPQGIDEADLFAAHQEGGQTCIQVFFFRTGQNWGNRAYYPKADRSLAVEEVLDAFIAQFYDDKPVPRLVLLSHDVENRELLGEALSLKAERKVEVAAPQRGGKRELVDQALANAREALGRRLAESSSQRRLLEGIAGTFGLDDTPRRIEVYDNSHTQGTNAVGAMIVAGPEGLEKGQYRKFNIRSDDLAPGDDYAMMREVLTRRFKRLLKEHPNGDPQWFIEHDRAEPVETVEEGDGTDAAAADEVNGNDDAREAGAVAWPDLVLVDGGKGQLAAAEGVLADLGIEGVKVVGIAKGPERDAGREHFHMSGRQVFMLEPRDPVLYFIQRLRDEAHRFAIGTHRARRSKEIARNPLDEIPGIGPSRKRALMKHFGSAKSVSKAGVADLLEVEGISQALAQQIYDFFHEAGR
ncbi:MAG: excinuclease ABC subunit UvrC [Rhizobiales bacterium]|nr:excinuclease ABC subunit UvrC [Hyphomicrobiales bacterium]